MTEKDIEVCLLNALKHIAIILMDGKDVEIRNIKDGISIHEVDRKVVRRELHKDA